MGISLFKDGDRTYYRVTKSWNGKEHQVYVRIGKSEKKARLEAERIHADLEQRRAAFYERRKLSGEGFVHEDGRVIGLQLQKRERPGRNPSIEFKIRVKEPGQPARFKSVSVGAYGLDEAFRRAIGKICEMKGVSPEGPAFKKMIEARPIYQQEYAKLVDEPSTPLSADETSRHKSEGFLDQLKGSLQGFLRSRTTRDTSEQ